MVFNLTGGFKSLNGYLQTLAMILADRCVFIFEGARELMEIPQLPVRLSEIDELREHVTLFRRLAVGYTVRADEAKGVPDSLLMEIDGDVTTSVLGDVAWARHRATLFAEQLQSPLSSKVRVADAVQKTFSKLEAKRKVQVNEAIDEFCAYVVAACRSRALSKSSKGIPYRAARMSCMRGAMVRQGASSAITTLPVSSFLIRCASTCEHSVRRWESSLERQ